jgi:pilus assembly protein FimV
MSVGLKRSLAPLVLVVPTAGFAIGLGDIHVESALNEPLTARIDIVSATPEDLMDLRAAIANREIFQRYGADRPSFLASARFKVTEDSQGHPFLQVTSDEPFTEPVVSLLVDLRWHKGELIREYPLLLDPADFAMRVQKAEAAVAASGPQPAESAVRATRRLAASPARALVERSESPSAATTPEPAHSEQTNAVVYRVTARDTLRGIARRVAKSRGERMLQRTMIALFRANPSAFDGNINRLHSGALLTLPSSETLAAISANEARIEVREQMSAWHRKGFFVSPQVASAAAPARAPEPAPAPVPAVPASAAPSVAQNSERSAGSASRSTPSSLPLTASAPPSGASATAPAVAATTRPASAEGSANDSLEQRIQSLEQALNDTKRILTSEHATLQSLQQYVAETASAYPVTPAKSSAAKDVTAEAPQAAERRLSKGTIWGLIGAAAALVLLTAWKWRTKRAHTTPKFPPVAHEEKLATVLADSPFATEFKDRVVTPAPAAAARESSAPISTPAAAVRETAKAVAVEPAPSAAAEPETADSGDTTISLVIDGAVGEHTVNLAAPTQQIPVDTARLIALNELERELEASYDPTATDVFEHVPISQLAARNAGATAQHVQMPSKLAERPVVAQERTNIIEVLRKAIEADPRRLDLRLKLLELYFGSDVSGREEFVEVARKLARTGEILTTSDWEKIMALGVHSDSTAVTQEQKVPGKLADCA